MHGGLKKFGNNLKVTKKENKKAIQEVAKAYNDSKKKADKARANLKEGEEMDEKALMAQERETADLRVYKFYVDYASKRCCKDIINVYKHCGNKLACKPMLKLSQKNKSRLEVTEKSYDSPQKKPKAKQSEKKILPDHIEVAVAEEDKEPEKLKRVKLQRSNTAAQVKRPVEFLRSPKFGMESPTYESNGKSISNLMYF